MSRGPAVSTINWQGFPQKLIPAVGRLVIHYPRAWGTCTGTVVTRTLVLTAAHCVYNPKAGGGALAFAFAPGFTWANLDAETCRTPYGVWAAGSQNWWAPRGYLDRLDPGLDFALVEFGPQPGWLSSTTGSFTATWNLRYTRVRQYIVGYPSDGFWSTKAGTWGFGQYACDSTYDGNWETVGSGYLLWTACTMNRGSSGGPWFIQLTDGTWTIGAVTSQCSGPRISAEKYCYPWSNYSRGLYLNDNFRDFWRGVQPKLHW
jgi:Trypsin-like peptidase domain